MLCALAAARAAECTWRKDNEADAAESPFCAPSAASSACGQHSARAAASLPARPKHRAMAATTAARNVDDGDDDENVRDKRSWRAQGRCRQRASEQTPDRRQTSPTPHTLPLFLPSSHPPSPPLHLLCISLHTSHARTSSPSRATRIEPPESAQSLPRATHPPKLRHQTNTTVFPVFVSHHRSMWLRSITPRSHTHI